jgi:hypothetical protein
MAKSIMSCSAYHRDDRVVVGSHESAGSLHVVWKIFRLNDRARAIISLLGDADRHGETFNRV